MTAMANVIPTKPARPMLTPVFCMALLFWPACAMCFTSGRGLDAGPCTFTCALLGLAACILLVTGMVLRDNPLPLYACAAVLGCSLGLECSAACLNASAEMGDLTLHEVEVTAVGDSKNTSFGESAFLRIDQSGTIVYAQFDDSASFLNGEALRVSGTCTAPDWSKDEYLWSHAACARLKVSSYEKEPTNGPYGMLLSIRASAIERIGNEEDSLCFLQAIVCGYRRSLDGSSTYASFQTCGLAHLVAVSGAHLVIVTGLFASMLYALHAPRRFCIFAIITVMALYLVLSGMPVSALRAAMMSSIGVLSLFGKRRPSALNSVGIGVFAILSASPEASVSASFALSCLSTLGIVLFAPLLRYWIGRTALNRITVVADVLSVSLAANMLSLPYACSLFHQLPIVSPLSNVICAPLFPLVCTLGLISALMACMSTPFASWALAIAKVFAGAFCQMARLLALLPFASVPASLETCPAVVFSAAASLVVWLTWTAIKPKHVAICLIACIVPLSFAIYATTQEDAIVMLDVGQGDAFLIRSRGQTLLIDTGNEDGKLLEQLASCRVAFIDSVLLTHADDDHVGSLDALDRSIHVKRVIIARGIRECESQKTAELVKQAADTADDIVEVGSGDSFYVGNFKATVIWPRKLYAEGGNDDSICLLVSYDADNDGNPEHTALFTGDAEAEVLHKAFCDFPVGHVDILKVGHHGSREAVDARLLEDLNPEVALIGVGAQNRYGHPSQDTLDLLDSAGCNVFRTDVDGQVKCLFSGDSIRIALQ